MAQASKVTKQVEQLANDDDMQFSDDSGFGRELPSDDERTDLGFTTDGSSMFSRADEPVDNLSNLFVCESKQSKSVRAASASVQKPKTASDIKLKQSNVKQPKKKT